MRSRFFLCFLLCCTVTLQAQKYIEDITSLVNKTHTERTLMLTTFYEDGIRDLDSITIFKKINEIELLGKKKSDTNLVLEAGLMRLHYYSYRDYFKKELVVHKIEALIDIAKIENVWWLEIRAESLLANYLYNTHEDYGKGFEHFERTAQLLEPFSGEEFPLKKICLYQLGRVYYDFKDYKEAIDILRSAENTSSKLDDYYYQMHITNTSGVAYRKTNKIDSSFYYFKKTRDKAIAREDNIWLGLSSGNIGYNYFLEGNYTKAKPFLELDYKIAKETDDPGWLSDALSNMASNNLAQNNIEKVEAYIDEAYKIAQNPQHYNRLKKIFPIKAKLEAYKLNPELTSKYLDSTLIVNDSLDKMFDAKQLVLAKQRIQSGKQKIEDERVRLLNTRRLYIRNGVIIGLGFFIIIGALLYNRYKLRIKNKLQALNAEKQSALQNLSIARHRLDDFKKSILNKNVVITQLESDVKESNTSSNSKKTAFESITILTEKDWREFVTLFEDVHGDFFARLKLTFPNLTPSETKLLALSRLKFDNKEMALMLGVGTSAIRQAKSRLRKKIKLEENETIQFLASKI